MSGEIKTWWILRGAEREGPYSRDELRAMVISGSLQGEDLLWKGGLAAPVHASTVAGLMPEETDPPPYMAAPSAPSQKQEDTTQPLTPGKAVTQPDKNIYLVLASMAGIMLAISLLLCGTMVLEAGIKLAWGLYTHIVGPIAACVCLFMMLLIVAGRMTQARNARLRQSFAGTNGYEFTERVTPDFGAAIMHGAILTRGYTNWPRFNLLRGLHRRYYFQAIDYFYSQGRGGFTQTVVAVRLRQDNPVSFAIVRKNLDLASERTGMMPVKAPPAELAQGQLLVTHRDSTAINLPAEFIHTVAQTKGANVEVLKDRLLVYRLGTTLTGEDYIPWVDLAISLEAILARQHPDNTEHQ